MLSKKRKPSPLSDLAEFQLAPLPDDEEFHAGQAALSDAENAMLTAEARYAAAQAPAEERAAWREVENTRAALNAASEKLAEIAGRKSLEFCRTLRPEQHRCLRALLEALEAASDAFACLAGIESRILTTGHAIRSDVLGIPLPAAIHQLGSSNDFGSQLSHFRRRLQAEGICVK
jgi:hypothetical protein